MFNPFSKDWWVGRSVAQNRQEALMGKLGPGFVYLWRFLDGWKSWIVACVAVYKLACVHCASSGYLDAIVNALGWNTVQSAFDPVQTFTAAGVILALGHRLIKAIVQYKRGVAAVDLLSTPIPPKS